MRGLNALAFDATANHVDLKERAAKAQGFVPTGQRFLADEPVYEYTWAVQFRLALLPDVMVVLADSN
jgi:hypothetical protein